MPLPIAGKSEHGKLALASSFSETCSTLGHSVGLSCARRPAAMLQMSLASFVTFAVPDAAFAAQSLLAALGSVQFIANVVFGRLVLKEPVSISGSYGPGNVARPTFCARPSYIH